MRFGSKFRADVALEDGSTVFIRPVRPDDANAVREAYAQLSPGSRFFRFLGGAPALTDDVIRYLVEADGTDHFVLVAALPSLDLKTERLVGGGSFVRLPGEPDVAEVSVTVIDELQNRGLGEALLRVLRDAALERGISRFRAEVHEENGPMIHLLDRAGIEPQEREDGVLYFDIPLGEASEEREQSFIELLTKAAMGGILRALARLRFGGPPSLPSPLVADSEALLRGSERPNPDDLP